MNQTLPKRERLSGRTAVSTLMKKGRWGVMGCLKYCYLSPGGDEVTRIMVSVSKRSFKRAVRRNLLKRRIREAYRLQKQLLPAPVDVMFIYLPKEVLPFGDIYAAMTEVLTAISAKMQ